MPVTQSYETRDIQTSEVPLSQINNIEDILNTAQRPKIENFDEYLFITIKMMGYDETTDDLSPHQISLVLGSDFILSFHEGGDDPFNQLRQRMNAAGSRTRLSGTDYLAYCMVDIVVDNYFSILDQLGERIDVLEEEVVRNPQAKTLKFIHKVKKDIVVIKVQPIKENDG